jgi:hypothetical protein
MQPSEGVLRDDGAAAWRAIVRWRLVVDIGLLVFVVGHGADVGELLEAFGEGRAGTREGLEDVAPDGRPEGGASGTLMGRSAPWPGQE